MSTAATDLDFTPANDERQPALPLRSDTLLGVCEAIGQDFGFHPNLLRVPFAALMLWNPPVVIASYLGLGCVVAASRWLFPARTSSETVANNESLAIAEARECEERLAA